MSKKTKEQALVISALEEDLLTLLYQRSLYGLEFVNAIKEASRGTRELGLGSLYPTLARLEKNKLVTWRWGDEQTGPRRKYYDITPFGRATLENTWRFRKALLECSVEAESETFEHENQSVVGETKSLMSKFSKE
ncbi:helix-turn-helix transcriptional regulator (plasmid) [Trichormus variabilis ARAD]|uniref:Transcriptional regulator, PadR family, putative n=2 Tax=Anabaena variabilis TaxID=264691 RepID=R9WU71_TRIV2|nr:MULTISPECIES: PadR family transcriptional regulator [Nostocaceae]AGO03674.1 transcriptional regulator, PadR family, putative [Trichormus variabilis ATCC 29413]MBC1218377.1 helix-turn-helix transcriptional regulator [Trichormus variabilis ARAD]MBC1259652.1 helix-turn-helix transcriptional regulator [Trichormus variabilis V5]MBC1271147.1 helix-turn-helix transcriptional regulator [Trichormus variabilis FSR]MBC1306066.1 helix-turn-helix transcriptional regulator [Trichormus variabilis N2B]